MPKDLVQESSGDVSLLARAGGDLLGLVDAAAHRRCDPAPANRFDALLNLYSSYVEDDYDDCEAPLPDTACRLTDDLSDQLEHLILERAINSLCVEPVRQKRSFWRSFRVSVRSLVGA